MKIGYKFALPLIIVLIFISACVNREYGSLPDNNSILESTTTSVPIADVTRRPNNSYTLDATSVIFETVSPVNYMFDWKKMPVVPENISQRTLDIYNLGQKMHNNPYAFSVVGDCESSPSWFLGDFDRGASFYSLGDQLELKLVINAFQGSFERKNFAVGNGFNTAAVLSPFWADPESCLSGETPLDCEVRLHHPSFVFILLGTNDIYNLENFEKNTRKILDRLVEQGIIPILATKADDLEGGNAINATIYKLALEYDIPMWNFWNAVQLLPNRGLQEDGAHLTWAKNDFGDPKVMENAWPWRNLTALQVLDFVWRAVQLKEQ
jgi:hypothetical protein